jgi:hypothetical protein
MVCQRISPDAGRHAAGGLRRICGRGGVR